MDKVVLMWLAGLLSTDGSISKLKEAPAYHKHSTGITYQICSSELEWLERIQKRLTEVSIETAIRPGGSGMKGKRSYRLNIHHPRKITRLFIENEAEKFFNPRKWEIVKKAYDYYFKTSKPGKHWSPEQNQILTDYFEQYIKGGKLWKCEGGVARPAPIFEVIAKRLNRTPMAIVQRCYKLRLHKR